MAWRGDCGDCGTTRVEVVLRMSEALKISLRCIDCLQVYYGSLQLSVAAGADAQFRGRMMPCVASTLTVGSRCGFGVLKSAKMTIFEAKRLAEAR